MHSNNKNIIIILIDALRFDKLKVGGYKYDLTPNLNKIINEGSLIKNHFANGCPTSVSFPAIFSSTFPLDYNGYNTGIKDRPKSVIELFKQKGYQTMFIAGHDISGPIRNYERGAKIIKSI